MIRKMGYLFCQNCYFPGLGTFEMFFGTDSSCMVYENGHNFFFSKIRKKTSLPFLWPLLYMSSCTRTAIPAGGHSQGRSCPRKAIVMVVLVHDIMSEDGGRSRVRQRS